MERRLQPTLSPRLQYAVRLLQMSSINFVSELKEVANRNPFLEVGTQEDRTVDAAPAANEPSIESPPPSVEPAIVDPSPADPAAPNQGARQNAALHDRSRSAKRRRSRRQLQSGHSSRLLDSQHPGQLLMTRCGG
jgi:RNA polymerase sigma-54 factor